MESSYSMKHNAIIRNCSPPRKISTLIVIIGLLTSYFSLSAQNIDASFFRNVDSFLKRNVENGLVKYGALSSEKHLDALISMIAKAEIDNLDDKTKIAFYINAYNLIVIDQVVKNYPIQTVRDIPGFFEHKKYKVAGEKLSLDKLHIGRIESLTKDPKLHFVLVCGALGCPKLANFAYAPDKLYMQLEDQTRRILSDDTFVMYQDNMLALSHIIKWHFQEFGGSHKKVLQYINTYRASPFSEEREITYYPYNWQLNEYVGNSEMSSQDTSIQRYIVTAIIPKGTIELKIFNNLYSERTGIDGNLQTRTSFFTTSTDVLYGLNNRFNMGMSARFRRTQRSTLPISIFSVLNPSVTDQSRTGLTAIGPLIRWSPYPKWSRTTIQSSLLFPLGSSLEGTSDLLYIDWDGLSWYTKLATDISIRTKYALYTEIGLVVEDMGVVSQGASFRTSLPATAILSFVPQQRFIVYTIASFSPFLQKPFDFYYQAGLGSKYQITSNVEVEVLYTIFSNRYLTESKGRAETLNVGLRLNF